MTNIKESDIVLNMIRRDAMSTLERLSRGYPIIAITGPRQSGKTTLARAAFPDKPYVSLEDIDQRELAIQDPRGFLGRYPDGAVLDEVQRTPALFSYLQTLVDSDGRMGLFVLTGSQQFSMLSGISQSLAGRVGFVQLLPFSLSELTSAAIDVHDVDNLLFQGLYPPLYDREVTPESWYAGYVTSYVERDLRQLITVRDLATFQRFVRMCAARTGQLVNLSSLANDCGITHNTAKSWISILEASYLIFLLRPHHRNFNKRLIKTPKLYFYDPGLAAWLLGIKGLDQVSVHPQRGALFETWVISELLKGRFNRGLTSNLFYWRDAAGTEVDILAEDGLSLIPMEVKAGRTIVADYFISLDRWMQYAAGSATRAYVIYGGDQHGTRGTTEILPWRAMTEFAGSI